MAKIFINREQVGILSREEPVNRFDYVADAAPHDAVSLLMPVGQETYLAEKAGVLHPVFDMILPEGALREALSRMFSKTLPVFDDYELYQIVGRSAIGRLRCARDSQELDDVPAQSVNELLSRRNTAELFAALVQRYAQYSGVSGVQPKVLVRDDGSVNFGSLSGSTKAARLTTHGTTHIVKSFDARQYPGLAVNEYFCLRAARGAGLNVVNAELSHDGQLLAIERFDLLSDGRYAAFEDGCSLAGRLSEDKYTGSYEQLAATLARAIVGVTDPAKEMEQFFRSMVLSIAVRNGDAHRKNFGVLYNDPTTSVALAPTFDVVTTTPYIRQDTLALTIDGSKRWPTAKRLEKFGISRCGLRPEEAKLAIAQVVEAVSQTSAEMALPTSQELDPGAQEVIAVMRQQWSEGIASLTSRKTTVVSPQPADLPISEERAVTPMDMQSPPIEDPSPASETPKPPEV